jgi:hypothetical protein
VSLQKFDTGVWAGTACASHPKLERAMSGSRVDHHLIEGDGGDTEVAGTGHHARLCEDQLFIDRRYGLCQALVWHVCRINPHGGR